MSNSRKYSLIALVVIVVLGTVATFAVAKGWWELSTLLDYGATLVVVMLLMFCTQLLSRILRTEARRARTNTEQLGADVVTSVANLERTNAELQRLIRFQVDELAIIKNEIGVLETKVDVSRIVTEAAEGKITHLLGETHSKTVDQNHFNDFAKHLRATIRDSERRLMDAAPKAVEVRRVRERIESVERRILGAFETEMYSHNSNLLEGTNMVDRLIERVEEIARTNETEDKNSSRHYSAQPLGAIQKAVDNLKTKINRHVTTTVRDSTRQIEALIHLSSRFEDKKLPMPSTGGFAIDAQALGHLIALVEEYRPKRILELGSGTSTVWLGYLCRSYGAEIITIDHLEEYLEQTQEALRMHHLDSVESRLAPLRETEYHGDTYNWYSLDAFEGLQDIDMLVIDGPPEATGHFARYPALPALVKLLATKATVILDDAHRDNESNIIKKWLETYPEFERLENSTSRLGILQRRS